MDVKTCLFQNFHAADYILTMHERSPDTDADVEASERLHYHMVSTVQAVSR